MVAKIRRMFPGGNTSEGFYSYFDNILGKDANRLYILKGGPGTGKSTIMRRFAEKALELDYDLEYHHCASDPSSVDVVVVPELKVAILDGTNPHAIEPKVPGAIDEIINLGEFWKKDELIKNKESIKDLLATNSKHYVRTYKYLNAARKIYEDIVWKNSESLNLGKKNIEIKALLGEVYENIEISEDLGEERHLFGSMYTPDGWIEYTDSILEGIEKIYYISGDIGTGKSECLETVYREGVKRGLDVEVFHSPLIPSKVETIVIKSINTALTLSKSGKSKAKRTIDLDEFIDKKKKKIHKEDIREDKEMVEKLIDIAIKNLKKTKKSHDELEKLYSPNMDFVSLERVTDNIINETFFKD